MARNASLPWCLYNQYGCSRINRQGATQLTGGTVRIILNEVSNSAPRQLHGSLDIQVKITRSFNQQTSKIAGYYGNALIETYKKTELKKIAAKAELNKDGFGEEQKPNTKPS
jgi:hypothetical protein